MPITFSALGTTLNVNVVDDNFESWQDIFRSGLIADDLAEKVDRYRIQFFQAGRVVRVISGAVPWRTDRISLTQGLHETFDITYRRAGEESGAITNVLPRVNAGPRSAYVMEMLGLPGGSFYMSYQEDGLDSPASYSATGWPPTWWPIDRYPKQYCFSRWLTIPKCSLKAFVPFPCVARVYATATGTTSLFSYLVEREIQPVETRLWVLNQTREDHGVRTGLIVDTNPILFADEFTNDNQWIVDPVTGTQAPYRSWKVIRDITQTSTARQSYTLAAEVALKGNRHYNFRAVFRDALTHGWLDHTTDPPSFEEDCWEDHFNDGAIDNAPTSTDFPKANRLDHPFYPPWICLWERGSLMVEFDYGRTTAYNPDEDSEEFSTKPSTPDPGPVF